MPREKAYSSFNISGEGSTLPKSVIKEYADSATRRFFNFCFCFKKKIFKILGCKKRLVGKDKN